MRLLDVLQDVLWPRGFRCLCCDDIIDEELLCPTCQRGLAVIRLSETEGALANGRSVFRYDGVAKRLVLMLKHNSCLDAASVLASGMLPALQAMKLPENTVLTWVTMPAQRKAERGFDHGYELCKALGKQTNMQVKQLLNRNVKYLRTQRGLNRDKRLKNLTGTFLCPSRIDTPVLLVDDVMTTGATASACEQALMAAGATQVYVITAARAMLADVMER